MNPPLVTVILTTYNCEKYLDISIQSILQQSHNNLELIIVDDNSKDQTEEILRGYLNDDPRVRVITLRRNMGTYVCKNIGILSARGEWVTFQDADDYSHSERLSRQLRACTHYSLEGCYCSFIQRKGMRQKTLAEISLFIRLKTLRSQFGFFHCVRFGADSEMRGRLNVAGIRYTVLPDCLYFCVDKWSELNIETVGRSNSLTNNRREDMRQLYKRAYTAFHQMGKLLYTFPNMPFRLPSIPEEDGVSFYPPLTNIQWKEIKNSSISSSGGDIIAHSGPAFLPGPLTPDPAAWSALIR